MSETGRPGTAAPTTVARLAHAMQLHQRGKLAEAASAYQEILARQPDHPEALNYAGLLAYQMGQRERGLAQIERSVALAGEDPTLLCNLGKVLQDLGRLEQAAAQYWRALARDPRHLEARFLLGTALELSGRLEDAEAAYRQALELDHRITGAYRNLGNLCRRQGRAAEAVAWFRQALEIAPGDPVIHCDLARVLKEQDRPDEAERSYRRAIELAPGLLAAYADLGTLLCERDLDEAAAAVAEAAVAANPREEGAYLAASQVLQTLGRIEAAESILRRLLEIAPQSAAALNALGGILWERAAYAESTAACEMAVRLQPNAAAPWTRIGVMRKEQGRIEEALAAYRKAIALEPQSAALHSNLVATLNCTSDVSAEEIWAESRRWNGKFGHVPHARIEPHANAPKPERRLRIGYVSADFRRHSVATFFEPLLAAHDRRVVEVICYAELARLDATSKRIQAGADVWRNTAGQGDRQFAALVRQDSIDILVDLGGHTAHNRLCAFALCPAPLQVTWLGYPNTTGLDAMDYRITDAVCDPPDERATPHSERRLRLRRGFHCYAPPPDAPDVVPPPSASNGFVTFGSFNNLSKTTPEVVAIWSELLRDLPDARILLKSRALADDATRERYRGLFAAQGIAAERIDLIGHIESTGGHLGAYGRIDIALDTCPYNGTTTTCEALWMGVPVITLTADRPAGRVGASLLTQAGLEGWIATAPADFVGRAAALTADPNRLADLRAGLRGLLTASPLMDAAAFARALETAYREIWRDWCRRRAPN